MTEAEFFLLGVKIRDIKRVYATNTWSTIPKKFCESMHTRTSSTSPESMKETCGFRFRNRLVTSSWSQTEFLLIEDPVN
ncbi:hypothetical protein C482_00125 [Natrialba chahannaoensis JCM 10990]|uniref:FERM domain-containing protein n=1 Tax=Natrialba chahannaoensis JCM 10990 TaxID=1227492 RepID=M0B5I8_9EURY|nr:hypothetical protein C482_00125 [Natrialba chahannaoensis JCM 10990]